MPSDARHRETPCPSPPRHDVARQGESVVVKLPDTAVVTLRDGRAIVALAAAEYRLWLEDRLDISDSLAALADRQPRQSFDDVMRELEIKA